MWYRAASKASNLTQAGDGEAVTFAGGKIFRSRVISCPLYALYSYLLFVSFFNDAKYERRNQHFPYNLGVNMVREPIGWRAASRD